MITGASTVGVELWWTARRSRYLLAAVHVPFLVVAPLLTVLGFTGPAAPVWLVTPLAVAIGGLQLRHSFATAEDRTPRAWRVTLGLLSLLVFVPLPWFSFNWGAMQWMFIASITMLLRGPVRTSLVVAPMVGSGLWAAVTAVDEGAGLPTAAYFFMFWVVSLSGGALCLYAAARLVRAVDHLFAARANLAETTIEAERIRVSRDLHDLLGQSLAAVSLKGDLALSLLPTDQSRAVAEIRSLSQLARDALHDIRHIATGSRPISFSAEIGGARALLDAASIHTEVTADLDRLSPGVDELFGWAVREGATNILRHSEASTCSIAAGRRGAVSYFEIINDGVAVGLERDGTGISGLTERAQSLSGTVTTARLPGGRFRLRVQVPVVKT